MTVTLVLKSKHNDIMNIIIKPQEEFIMNKTDLINAVAEQADLTKKKLVQQ